MSTLSPNPAEKKILARQCGGKRARMYFIFSCAIGANALLSYFVATLLPREVAIFVASLLTTITTILVTSAGAPVFDRLKASLSRWSWKNGHAITSGVSLPLAQEFERVYVNSAIDLSNIQIQGRMTAASAKLKLDRALTDSRLLVAVFGGSKEGLRQAAHQLAQTLFDTRQIFPEIRLADALFAEAAHSYFTSQVLTFQNAAIFIDDLETKIQELTSRSGESSEGYSSVFQVWFAPRSNHQ